MDGSFHGNSIPFGVGHIGNDCCFRCGKQQQFVTHACHWFVWLGLEEASSSEQVVVLKTLKQPLKKGSRCSSKSKHLP